MVYLYGSIGVVVDRNLNRTLFNGPVEKRQGACDKRREDTIPDQSAQKERWDWLEGCPWRETHFPQA